MVLSVALSPIVVLWAVVWFRRPDTAMSALSVIGLLLVFGAVSLIFRTVSVDDTGIAQGWPPLVKRIAYSDIDRIHQVFISYRGASSPCLAITARGGRREIRLPLKSFSVEKRRQLVTLLVDRAPDVRVDKTVSATLA